MIRKKERILTYKIPSWDFESVSDHYGDSFDVIDASACFEDVLALPAFMLILNPEALTEVEFDQLNDLFQWDPDTMLVFTAKPKRPDKIRFSYYVEDDEFSNLEGTWGTDELIRQKNAYDYAVRAKDQLLSDIDALITPAEELPIVGKTEELLNGIQLYQSLTDVIRYIKDIGENREREAFRTETLNILRSMEMACGLIGIDEAPFNHDPSEDWEWMISLSEIFISHRNHYLEHVSRL